ncbi:hypothetical protein ACHAXS_001581 [Conticribra weissflogii]
MPLICEARIGWDKARADIGLATKELPSSAFLYLSHKPSVASCTCTHWGALPGGAFLSGVTSYDRIDRQVHTPPALPGIH